jgi:hypothetical protein
MLRFEAFEANRQADKAKVRKQWSSDATLPDCHSVMLPKVRGRSIGTLQTGEMRTRLGALCNFDFQLVSVD